MVVVLPAPACGIHRLAHRGALPDSVECCALRRSKSREEKSAPSGSEQFGTSRAVCTRTTDYKPAPAWEWTPVADPRAKRSDAMINQQVLQGNWNEIKGKLRHKWGQLTNDDVQSFDGNVDRLL